MSDGPNRNDPEKDFLGKPEFKIEENAAPQLRIPEDSLTDNSELVCLDTLNSADSTTPSDARTSSDSVGNLVANSKAAPKVTSDSAIGLLTPVLPVAPKYSGLPFPITLIVIACGICALGWWIEPLRARAVVTILDTKGVQAPDFVDAHINLAQALYRAGAHNAASDSLKSALAMVAASPSADKVQQVSLLLRLAQSQYDGGAKDEAEQTAAQALVLLKKETIAAVPISVCWQLDALAHTIERDRSDHVRNRKLAIRMWLKAIEYFRDINPVLITNFYSGLANAQMKQHEYTAAAANFMEFIRHSEIRGDRLWRAQGYRQAAFCYDRAENYELAQSAATKAIEMCVRLGPSANRELAYSQYHLGEAESHLGLQKAGIKHLNDSLEGLKKYYPDEGCYTYALWYLANCYRDVGEHAQALKLYHQCINETNDSGSGPDIEDVRKDLDKMTVAK
jgi:tetratricopeptide (TPR) repeat protein